VEATVELVVDLVDALKRLAPFILTAGAAFGIATIGTSGFVKALRFLISPPVLIAAGILAIALVLDDLIVAFQGGNSVIANFFEEFFGWDIQPLLIGIVDGFKAAFATVTNLVTGVFSGIVKIFSGIGDILSGNFAEGFDKIGEGFMETIDSWAEAFRSVFGKIGEGFMEIIDLWAEGFRSIFGGVFDWLKQKALDILPDWVVKLIGGAGDAVSAAAGIAGDVGNWVGGLFGGEDMIAKSQAMQPGGAVTNVGGASSRVEQTVNMEIRTSDPERAGKAASDGMQRQLDDAKTQSRRGGM